MISKRWHRLLYKSLYCISCHSKFSVCIIYVCMHTHTLNRTEVPCCFLFLVNALHICYHYGCLKKINLCHCIHAPVHRLTPCQVLFCFLPLISLVTLNVAIPQTWNLTTPQSYFNVPLILLHWVVRSQTGYEWDPIPKRLGPSIQPLFYRKIHQ